MTRALSARASARPPLMLRHPRGRWRRLACSSSLCFGLRLQPRGKAQPDHARNPRHDLGRGQRDAARALRRLGAVRDPPARPARRRSTARARSWSAPCAATRRSRRSLPGTAARSAACGPDPARALIVADFHVGIDEAVDETVPLARTHPRRTIHAAGARDPDRLRDALAGDPGRVDRRHRARRADRPADPADRPPARLPLAGRGGDPARLRRRSRSSARAACSRSSPTGSTSTPSRSRSAR